jgi:hypothetical protein
MGFEISYTFTKPGSDQIHTGNVKVGDPFEDVSTDLLAGKVMALLARRAIFVKEIQIFELAKKPVNYRETEDGIVIKNKKFRFDDGATQNGVEVSEQSSALENLSPPITSSAQPMGHKRERAMRYEIFDTTMFPGIIEQNLRRGVFFTVGKRYPIYSEKIEGDLLMYSTEDDNGVKTKILSTCFVPEIKMDDRGLLNYGPGASMNDMPDLRR